MSDNSPNSRSRLLMNWSVLAVSLVSLGGAVWLFRQSILDGPGGKKKGGRAFSFTVKTAAVERGTLRPTLRLQGDIVPQNATTVRSEVSGVVTAMPAREGHSVKSGEVVVRVDDRDLRLALRRSQAMGMQAGATVKRQQASLGKAQDLLRRLQRLDKSKLVSAEDLDNARIAVSVAEAALAESRAQAALRHVGMLSARRALDRSVIRAPFAGRVSKRFVELGDRVAVGTPVAEVVGGRGAELRLYLPVVQVNRIRPGTFLRYRPAERPGRWHQARITRVLPIADPQSRNQTVVATIETPPDGVVPGLAVVAEVAVGVVPQAIIVSSDALTRFGNQWVVFRVVDGKAKRVPVRILAEAGIRVAVAGALQSGQPVVVVGNETLFPNAPVRVVNGRKMAHTTPRSR